MKSNVRILALILSSSILLCACNSNATSKASSLSEEAAKNIVLTEIPGATEEHIRLFKHSNDDGIRSYEGTIIYDNYKYEFEVDANDGTILEWEMEPVY